MNRFLVRGAVALSFAVAMSAASAAVPGAPAAPTATQVSNSDAAFVDFAPPASDGGSPITGYIVEASPAHGYDADYDTLSLSHYYVNLLQGETYTFTVKAKNADGIGPASAPSAPFTLPVIAMLSVADASVTEGTGGTTMLQLQATLSVALARDLDVYLTTQGMGGGEATGGVDFKEFSSARHTIPAGATSIALPVPVYGDASDEANERFRAQVMVGGTQPDVRELDWEAQVTILDDDSGRQPLQARPDYLLVGGAPEVMFSPIYNDVYDKDDLWMGRLTILSQPEEGIVVPWNAGGYDPTDDTFVWYPPEDFVGETSFEYELCDETDRCSRATVRFVSRLAPGGYPDVHMASWGSMFSGYATVDLIGVRYVPTAAVAPTTAALALGGNVRPERIWDAPSSAHVVARTIAPPADGVPRHVGVFAEAILPESAKPNAWNWPVHLYVGLDTNGDGKASADEVRCSDTNTNDEPRCDFDVAQGAGESVAYWVMVQSVLRDAVGLRLDVYEVPEAPANGTVAVSGPGIMVKGKSFDLHMGFEMTDLLQGDRRTAFVHLFDENGRVGSPAPYRIARTSTFLAAFPLQPGRTQTLRLAPGQVNDELFFDVPEGATSVTVTTHSDDEVNLTVARSTMLEDPMYTHVLREMSPAGTVSAQPGGDETVTKTYPQAGRWFVKVHNAQAAVAEVDVDVQVVANAPVVRQGSYFNPARPGSGLFLSPAGGEIAGLWYTYFKDQTPTWYYLQGTKPGPNGLWVSEVWRSAWDGDSNHLVDVGHATITPVGADRFRFSYVVDGATGSQTYQSLGRGCPTLDGANLDISSQWFDPATAGTGYSVQMWADYEFYAAFVYDRYGAPRFLSAERSGFGGATATLQLDQMRGECPTCGVLGYVPHNSRQPAGTFTRTIAGRSLGNVKIDATYAPSFGSEWAGSRWTGDDDVQLLGGAGTTQGCAP